MSHPQQSSWPCLHSEDQGWLVGYVVPPTFFPQGRVTIPMAASRLLLEDHPHQSLRRAQTCQNLTEHAVQARAADHRRKGWWLALTFIHICLGSRSGAEMRQGRGPESSQKCWESWREGLMCCSNTGLCFSRISHWNCLRHFVLDSQLFTCVPIKSEVSMNPFIHSQPVTSVLIECSGEEGGVGR